MVCDGGVSREIEIGRRDRMVDRNYRVGPRLVLRELYLALCREDRHEYPYDDMTRCVLCYKRWRLGEKCATSIRVYIVMKLNITNGRLSLTYIRCAYITRQHKTLAITDAHFNEVSRINCTDSSRYSSQQGGLFVNSTPRNTPLSRRTMHLSHNRMRAEIEKNAMGICRSLVMTGK